MCEDLVTLNLVLGFKMKMSCSFGCAQLRLSREVRLHLSIDIHTLGAVGNAVTGD
jgi:hypothetical protein